MSRCPEMQVASCASCMCEVLPLLACKRERERERRDTDDEVDDDVAPIVATLSQGNTLIMLQV